MLSPVEMSRVHHPALTTRKKSLKVIKNSNVVRIAFSQRTSLRELKRAAEYTYEKECRGGTRENVETSHEKLSEKPSEKLRRHDEKLGKRIKFRIPLDSLAKSSKVFSGLSLGTSRIIKVKCNIAEFYQILHFPLVS